MQEDHKILSSLQRTIIIKVDKNNNILRSYTKLFKAKRDQNLKDIFTEDQIKDLNNKENIFKWDDKEYEVYIKKENQDKILYFHDITRYSKIQSKLKQSLSELTSKKEELQAVFDMAANGISILDRSGKFLYANKFFQTMMEYSMKELYNESCISLSSPEYIEPSKEAVKKAIKHGKIEKFRKVCITKSGTPINASMSLSYLKSRDEIVMITSDITQDVIYQEGLKKRIEDEVLKRTEQYEIMSHQSRLAAMGEMINSIAHQWRQPLNGLGLIVQGLRHIANSQDVDKELLKEIEGEIMEKISFMSQTIDDFSTFFKRSKQKESFDVVKNINESIRLIDQHLRSLNIDISIDQKDLNDKNIYAFANEFRQVILNIIQNAMGAIEEKNIKKGKIDIILNDSNSHLNIKIIDNGGGIVKENINKIFDPYFTTKDKGSGIGLYMSKIIIEHHMQGVLKVENIKKGAMFNIKIDKKGLDGNIS